MEQLEPSPCFIVVIIRKAIVCSKITETYESYIDIINEFNDYLLKSGIFSTKITCVSVLVVVLLLQRKGV